MIPTLAQHAHSLTDVASEWPGVGEILRALTFQAGFNTTVVVAGAMLLGVAAGLVGSFAVLRRRALMADALSHATLPGIGLAFILAGWLGFEGRSVGVLLLGAGVTAVLGVLTVQAILRHTRLTEDAAIGAVLSVFFGLGVVILSAIQSMESGNQGGLKTFIYGQTAAMHVRDAILMGSIALGALLAATLLFKEFTLVCFDGAFARVTGWPVPILDLAIMTLVILVTVAGLQAVGLILVVAMLIIPAAAARFWSDRLAVVVALAALLGGLSGYLGAVASALLPRKPAGAVIVLVAGAVFAFSLLFAPRRGAIANALRLARLRLRVAEDHLLEALHDRAAHGQTPAPLADAARAIERSRTATRLLARWLSLRGLVALTNGHAALTEQGRAEGARIARNHRLWEQYLVTYADVAASHVDWSADQVEHVLSPELIAELQAALDAPARPTGAGA